MNEASDAFFTRRKWVTHAHFRARVLHAGQMHQLFAREKLPHAHAAGRVSMNLFTRKMNSSSGEIPRWDRVCDAPFPSSI